MPSRNILHGRGVGSKSRIRVRRIVGSSGALWTCKKVKGHRVHAGFGLLRDPLFLAPGMRSVSAFFAFGMFLWKSCSVSKMKHHRKYAGFGLLRDLLFWGPACVLYIRISLLGLYRVSESQGLRVSEFQSLRVPQSQSFRVSEFQSLRVSEFHSLRVSEFQSSRVSEFHNLRVSES